MLYFHRHRTIALAAGLGALSVTACSSDSTTAPMLITSVVTPADAACPASGAVIQQGLDTNGNGVLDPSEVTSTETFCGGVSMKLTVARALVLGDVDCPLGGVATQTGVDNGAGGGVADDGILQVGEVLTSHDACTALLGYTVPGFAPPAAVPNQPAFTISTHGGAGTTGGGGGGGSVAIYKDGSRGGHLKVFATGLAETSDTLPTYTPVFGATKLDVSASVTLARYDNPSLAIDGEYYYLGDQLVYRLDTDHAQLPVTGLHVAAGATLTLPQTSMQQLDHDIFIEGTVTSVAISPGNPASIWLVAGGAFIGGPAALITAAGAPVANAPGGNGGTIAIYAAMVMNQAALDSSGAAGDTGDPFAGGSAGWIQLGGNEGNGRALYNTGAITARGGPGGGGGAGGSGGEVDIYVSSGGIHNRGTITTTGGDGSANSPAGQGGPLYLDTQNGGDSVNSGDLITRGGDSDPACTAECSGGNGGSIEWYLAGGEFRQAGTVTTHGGRSVGGNGGSGGGYRISSREGYDPGGTGYILTGDVVVSGDMHLEGGDGASGGQGGSFEIDQRINRQPAAQEVRLLGYTSFVTSGGDGVTSGGGAGDVVLLNSPSYAECCDFEGTGAVLNRANLTARGGQSTTGNGGNGAQIVFEPGNGQSYSGVSGAELVLNTGAVDVSGGGGVTSGGYAGSVYWAGVDGLQNSGAITAHGGNASGDAASAGFTQNINLRSGAVLINSGVIRVGGGAATGTGGSGGNCSSVQLTAVVALNNSGAVTCDGGSASSGTGGGGGEVTLFNTFVPVVNTSTCSALGGTGDPVGKAGRVLIDGILQ